MEENRLINLSMRQFPWPTCFFFFFGWGMRKFTCSELEEMILKVKHKTKACVLSISSNFKLLTVQNCVYLLFLLTGKKLFSEKAMFNYSFYTETNWLLFENLL